MYIVYEPGDEVILISDLQIDIMVVEDDIGLLREHGETEEAEHTKKIVDFMKKLSVGTTLKVVDYTNEEEARTVVINSDPYVSTAAYNVFPKAIHEALNKR